MIGDEVIEKFRDSSPEPGAGPATLYSEHLKVRSAIVRRTKNSAIVPVPEEFEEKRT